VNHDDTDAHGVHEVHTAPIHLDAGGRPLCGREPAGELACEEPVHVTCSACLLSIGDRLRRSGS